MRKSAILFLTVLIISAKVSAQGTLSGDFMTNVNFFMKDSAIGAAGNPLYDNALSGGEAWLTLRYNVHDFTFFLRADAFHNSNLKEPQYPNSDFGIGAWSISKDLKKLSITVGSIYDQIGSGILFRSYEDRGLLIDNALIGLGLKYKVTDNITLKGLGGQVKNNGIRGDIVNNTPYAPIVKILNAEGEFGKGNVHFSPGIGVLNRTLDAASMTAIADRINSQPLSERFVPKYNMYAFTAYNMLTYKNFSWYMEAAYKTHEAIEDTRSYTETAGKLIDRSGNIQYTSLNWGKKGIALSLNAKRTENFVMRVSPTAKLTAQDGLMNWQPVVAVLRPQRLIARYQPASQEISELATTANLNLAPNENTSFTLTYTRSNTLKYLSKDSSNIYREYYAEGIYHGLDNWTLEGGVQYLEYNFRVLQNRPIPYQVAITPFAEITYRFDEMHSLRTELQYQFADYEFGGWAFALVEYNIAPKWSFAIFDIYNISPNQGGDNPNPFKSANHYPNAFVAYTAGANRFTLAYVKQMAGINCTGGVCRYEPAFSGIKATITSSF
jgi:hypothetical protein